MAKKLKTSVIAPDIRSLPSDYPFGDKVSESLADYAKRTGKNHGTIRTQADTGRLPLIQHRPGAKREVNLYAIYLNARYKAERYVETMN
ncbi:DNA-binding protein [Hafnia alvei]|uniref:DNA-binding protein n=1 Tax=Hafnia alvei TaxID=569 RepID=UPI000B69E38A|nr:DNA-binding protein [Hafnia alvei]MBI0277296.1 DNA-binding protein [Hafnia alvei]MBI0278507.1 DNA-binding protein [Hafnia alvei]PNK96249.1 DNA-binding protein [Hafnia alvei]PNK97582.1 DNA-binding protein [Hafnia alvei]